MHPSLAMLVLNELIAFGAGVYKVAPDREVVEPSGIAGIEHTGGDTKLVTQGAQDLILERVERNSEVDHLIYADAVLVYHISRLIVVCST